MRISLATWLTIYVYWICSVSGRKFSEKKRSELKEEVRGLYRHGYEGYMKYAWPADELASVTCRPLYRDPDTNNFGRNDVHGNISMTLLDNLSTLPLIAPDLLPDALEKVTKYISFDQNAKVQVFEMTIRALGGLLSTFQYLDELPSNVEAQAEVLGVKKLDRDLKKYQEKILKMALDLGKRFLPAFVTATGIPYSRVNLRHGVEKGETQETCAAGAGSLILEFAVLSRLTGDEQFELLAHKAYLAIWNRRSQHDLLGNTIGAVHGQWLVPGMSGVGAGIDSFFEYGIKAAILLNVFYDSYAAIQTHVRMTDGFIYRPIQFQNLQIASPSTIDSLSAFLPGMQILAGDIESAIKHHLVYWNLWRKYSAMPESWSWNQRRVIWSGWPGRPEFIEATYYLYKATRDPFYLRVGERFLSDMKKRVKTPCGFATMRDVETGELEDRMESFVLSETLKYLYLLFDDAPTPKLSNKVFTTEGHPLSLVHKLQRRPPSTRKLLHRGENLQCPKYRPPSLNGLIVGIEQRQDYDYARSLVFGPGKASVDAEDGDVHWREYGYCEMPSVPRYSVSVMLSPEDESTGKSPPIDPSPSSAKVHQDTATGDYIIRDVTELQLDLRWRLDNTGYDVATIGPHRIRTGQAVIVTDKQMEHYLPVTSEDQSPSHQLSEVILRFSTIRGTDRKVFLHAPGTTATFGRDFGKPHSDGWRIGGPPIRLKIPPKNQIMGCEPYSEELDGAVALVQRGECVFTRKSVYAKRAGGSGILVYDHDELYYSLLNMGHDGNGLNDEIDGKGMKRGKGYRPLIRPEGWEEDVKDKKDLSEIGMIFTSERVGQIVREIIGQMAGKGGGGEVEVELLAVDGMSMDQPQSQHSGKGERGRRPSEEGEEGQKAGKRAKREGRVALGQWEIMNLRIIGE